MLLKFDGMAANFILFCGCVWVVFVPFNICFMQILISFFMMFNHLTGRLCAVSFARVSSSSLLSHNYMIKI